MGKARGARGHGHERAMFSTRLVNGTSRTSLCLYVFEKDEFQHPDMTTNQNMFMPGGKRSIQDSQHTSVGATQLGGARGHLHPRGSDDRVSLSDL